MSPNAVPFFPEIDRIPFVGRGEDVRSGDLDRALGFHIYDISCKSPNVEATKPLVYVTTLLLMMIVVTMTSLAIWMRNRMRSRYQSRSI